MAKLIINKIDKKLAKELIQTCPFNALYDEDDLKVNDECKLCSICVKKSNGNIYIQEDNIKAIDKSLYKGICVYVDHDSKNIIHPVVFELLNKARELSSKIKCEVNCIVISSECEKIIDKLNYYDIDNIYAFNNCRFKNFNLELYSQAFSSYIKKFKPSSILIGATCIGRSLAPYISAKFKTGLTADCTKLEMNENSDLIQIRPAFGGNIMAEIITPNSRPQLCTVRYKVFNKATKLNYIKAKTIYLDNNFNFDTKVNQINEIALCKEIDISEADVIIAVGKGIKTKEDLKMVYHLASLLNAQVACTRPLIENSFFDAKKQIGLSGRTVNAKLIITIGISGSVQFAAGMKNSECIVAINKDCNASIFDICHYGFVGDLYQIVPNLIKQIEKDKENV